jgi:hypothetical protein
MAFVSNMYDFCKCWGPILAYNTCIILYSIINRIGGIMVSMLALSAVNRGFEPRSGQTKDYKIGICFFSAKHAAFRRKSKDGWLGIRIMCPSGATCLPVDCCFSELAL